MSYDLIVEPGRMDRSVEMVVRAGLQDFCPGKWCVGAGLFGLLSTRVLPPGAHAVFAEKFVGLGMDFWVSTWARPAWFRILHG